MRIHACINSAAILLLFGFGLFLFSKVSHDSINMGTPAALIDHTNGGTPKTLKSKIHLVVFRGLKTGVEYPIFEGDNFLGRADALPVDIELEFQEEKDRIWSSRQHALIRCTNGQMTIEDLKTDNGTYVNRTRLEPGRKSPLKNDDVIQIGSIQMRLVVAAD